MIEVQSLTRCYANTTAVDAVSFTIGNGEIVGLLGHNGAGKTTIMRMLSGYLEPSAGSIMIDNHSVTEQPASVQRHLGYLPENLPVYPEMMVADYLEYAATLKGIDKHEQHREVREALAATDLESRALDRIHALSRGLKQRVGVAQAILGKPRLLILDEPTNGLDPGQTEHMRRLIKRLARRATVILSTHIMQEVSAVCDRVLVLRNGKLALDQRLDLLTSRKVLQLTTDDSVPELAATLRHLPQVQSLTRSDEHDGMLHFNLHMHEDININTAANNVAQCVITAGARLYQVQAQEKDLDTVFHEVNANGD